VVNLANSHYRRKRVERAYLLRQRAQVPGQTAPVDLDSRNDLWSVLQHLPARQRAAIVLRFYEDLSEQRVAELLNCRPGTVKSLVSRGLEALRPEIRGE
jgi:RNA polymerase sigma factor (sigma-70 family)